MLSLGRNDGPFAEKNNWSIIDNQTETFSALLAVCAVNAPVTGEFPAQRPVTRSFDVCLICVWINGYVNKVNEAGNLRRHHVHCYVIAICK